MMVTFQNFWQASIFAYGTAGSGKSHTLFGPRENPGLGPQCVATLLRMAQDIAARDVSQPLLQVCVCLCVPVCVNALVHTHTHTCT